MKQVKTKDIIAKQILLSYKEFKEREDTQIDQSQANKHKRVLKVVKTSIKINDYDLYYIT